MIVARLRRDRQLSFRALVSDAGDVPHVVARFLALLELFREGAVVFEQAAPLADLMIAWTGSDEGDVAVTDEFDDELDPAQQPARSRPSSLAPPPPSASERRPTLAADVTTH